MKKVLICAVLVVVAVSMAMFGCQPASTSAPASKAPAPATSAAQAPSSAPAPAPSSSAPAAPKPTAAAPSSTAAPAPAAKSIELSLAHYVPTMHVQHAQVLAPWAAEVAKRTEGRVTVKIYPSEALGKTSEEFDMVTKGTADMVWMGMTFIQGRFPMEDVLQLPFTSPPWLDIKTNRLLLNYVYDKYLIPTYFSNLKVMWPGRFNPNVLHMVSKPVKTLEDWKGQIIGIPGGPTFTMLVQLMGASPEVVQTPDMYTALERKTVQGQIIPLEAAVARKLIEVVKYETAVDFVFSTASNVFLMRNEAWAKITPADQKIIDDLRTWGADLYDKSWAATIPANIEVVKKAGVQYMEVDAKEKPRWVEAAAPMEANWIKQAESKGMPAQKMVDDLKAYLKSIQPPSASPAAK